MALVAPRRWLRDEASRLDASCYATGGAEARERVIAAAAKWLPLAQVADVYVGARFARTYVKDPTRGVPYLTASDMLLNDLVGLSLLSRARTPQLGQLAIRSTWTLVSCSGTIGRTVYVRREMDGMVLSHDAIRVVANEGRVLPGFLFAFLSSQNAQAMIRQRAYGSVVQHIEPHHIADLPVPIANPAFERRVHDLVADGSSARTEAAGLFEEAFAYFEGLAGPMPSTHDHSRAVGVTRRAALAGRLDAFHHVGWAAEGSTESGDRLGSLATVWRPGIIRRIWTSVGVPFISGIDAYQVGHPHRQRLRADAAASAGALVSKGDLLVQRSGQRYGMFGRPAVVSSPMDGWAASEDLIRVRPSDEASRARILAYFKSQIGRRALLRTSYGTSIPHLNPDGVMSVPVPPLPDHLVMSTLRGIDLRERADLDEERAIKEVDDWLA